MVHISRLPGHRLIAGGVSLLFLVLLSLSSHCATSGWLFTQRGAGYCACNVGMIVYDFQGNEIALAQPGKLKNFKSKKEPVPEEKFQASGKVLVKYSPDPEYRVLWARQATLSQQPYVMALQTDRAGAIYAAGSFKEPIHLVVGEELLSFTPSGADDCIVIKWNPDGTLAWARPFGGPTLEQIWGLALDAAGNYYVAGEFKGTLEFKAPGRNYVFSTPAYDFFLAKFSGEGVCQWARRLTGAKSIIPPRLQTDESGNCLITGGFEDKLQLTGTSRSIQLLSRGQWDLFLAKFSSEGDLLWARSDGGPDNEYGNRLLVDNAGWSYIDGQYGKGVVFGEGEKAVRLECLEETDRMIACYDAEGHFVSAMRAGGRFKLDDRWTTTDDAAGNGYLVDRATDQTQRLAVAASTRSSTNNASQTSGVADARPPGTASSAEFKSISLQPDGSIQIIFAAAGPTRYVIEVSEDLHHWAPLSTNSVLDGNLIVEDARAAEFPARFYRVKHMNPGD